MLSFLRNEDRKSDVRVLKRFCPLKGGGEWEKDQDERR
jgi:hypothetical protein